MAHFLSSERVLLSLLALLIAISGIYAYHLISLLLPLLTLFMFWRQKKPFAALSLPVPFVFLFSLLFLAGLSIFWTQAPLSKSLHILTATSLTTLCSVFFISAIRGTRKEDLARFYTIILAAAVLLIFFIFFQKVMDFFHLKIFRSSLRTCLIKPSGSIVGLGIFTVCGLLRVYHSNQLAIASFLLGAIALYLTNCQTASYGLLFASAVFIISYLFPFWTTRVALITSYTALLLSAFLLPYISPLLYTPWVKNHLTFLHRIVGWEFLSVKFLENPLWGWGLGSTPYLPVKTLLPGGFDNVIHPHNSSLQVSVELGLGGDILFALFFSSLFWMVQKHLKDRLSIAVCNATLAFGFIQAEFTHSLWHNHWISWVAFLAGVLMIFLKARALQLRDANDRSMPIQGPQKE